VRIGVLSDIHGNIWALEAVLQDARHRAIDQFVNLGDVLYGPLQPRETFELLQTVDAVTIRGNQDRDMTRVRPTERTRSPTLDFALEEIGHDPLVWLNSLPETEILYDEIFACHGTPNNDHLYLLEDVTRGFPVVKTEEMILADLGGTIFPVILCGHTHIPRAVQLSLGSVIVNPGSVGLPAYDDHQPNYHAMQTFSPFASYAIIERLSDASWRVEQVLVPYNNTPAVQAAESHGRHDWADWLATGRVTG
jgi:predicted phosphodiesterase